MAPFLFTNLVPEKEEGLFLIFLKNIFRLSQKVKTRLLFKTYDNEYEEFIVTASRMDNALESETLAYIDGK